MCFSLAQLDSHPIWQAVNSSHLTDWWCYYYQFIAILGPAFILLNIANIIRLWRWHQDAWRGVLIFTLWLVYAIAVLSAGVYTAFQPHWVFWAIHLDSNANIYFLTPDGIEFILYSLDRVALAGSFALLTTAIASLVIWRGPVLEKLKQLFDTGAIPKTTWKLIHGADVKLYRLNQTYDWPEDSSNDFSCTQIFVHISGQKVWDNHTVIRKSSAQRAKIVCIHFDPIRECYRAPGRIVGRGRIKVETNAPYIDLKSDRISLQFSDATFEVHQHHNIIPPANFQAGGGPTHVN